MIKGLDTQPAHEESQVNSIKWAIVFCNELIKLELLKPTRV